MVFSKVGSEVMAVIAEISLLSSSMALLMAGM